MPLHTLSVVVGLALGFVAGGLAMLIFWRRTAVPAVPVGPQAAMLPIAALLDSIDDLAWIKDRESRFILVNRKFGEVFGVAPSDLIGKMDFDLSSPELAAQYVQDDKQVMRTRQPSRQEERIALGDGVFGWSETIKVPVLDDKGAVVGTAGVARDITERHQMQDMLEQRVLERTQALSSTVEQLRTTQNELVTKEKLAALGSLVAGVAHELNTPIGTSLTVATTLQGDVLAFSDRVKSGLTRSAMEQFVARSQEGIDILVHSLHKAAELVSSFKQVAVDQASTHRRRFFLDKTVAEIVLAMSPTMRRSTHRLECHIPPDIGLDSYPGPLGQVLTNLVNNAMLHAFEDGTGGLVQITAALEGESQVRMTVEDNGNGIPADHLPRIFDPFFTTKLGRGGSGLGLSIVYTLVNDALQGSITVASVAGQGTVFTLLLPLIASDLAP